MSIFRNNSLSFWNNTKKSAGAIAAADYLKKEKLYSWLIAMKSSAAWKACTAFMFDVSKTHASSAGFNGAVARSESRCRVP